MTGLARAPVKRLRSKLLLLCGSTAATLLVLEIMFRMAGICGDYHQPRVDRAFPIEGLTVEPAPFGFYTNSVIVSEYDSDPRGYFEPGNTISHVHNSVGWRDIEHTLDKPAGVFRILGLGDSYLWGQGVKREDICLTRLPGLLRETMPGTTIETINAGFSAFNTVNERDQLKSRGLAYDPDLVIVHFVLNDVEPDVFRKGPKVEFFVDYTGIYQSADRLSQLSYVWSWGRYRVLRQIEARRYIQECVDSFNTDSGGWRGCQEALRGLQAICREHQIGLCVVVFPFLCELNGNYPFRPIHAVVDEYCRSQGIPVLDLVDDFRNFEGPELWVHPTDQHPNEIAHEIAARAISRFLTEHAADLLKVEVPSE